jgi:hypothetical protein
MPCVDAAKILDLAPRHSYRMAPTKLRDIAPGRTSKIKVSGEDGAEKPLPQSAAA